MKRVSMLLACLLSAVLALPAQAHGFGHGHGGRGGYGVYGGHGGHHGGYGYRGGGGHHWVGPVLGAAIVGGAIYAVSSSNYVVPQTVVVQQHYVPPSRVAYFCPTSQQFYPNVPTCQVPWQPTHY